MLGRPGGPGCTPGTVYLVGGGPGDPGLLTCRAWTLLQSADVVLYDALVGERVRDCIGSEAQRVHVGKRSGNHRARQAEIEALMIQHALAGKRVVRLKGGDPMVFGRGGEEMTALRAAGVPYEVVPGISAALASGALSGVPLTHRDLSGAFTVLTGHDAAQLNRSSEHWSALAATDHTLVVLMGLRRLADIVERLCAGGRDPQTPVVVVQAASTDAQKVVSGCLENIAERVVAAGLRPPCTSIIGAVAGLHASLRWREESAGDAGFEEVDPAVGLAFPAEQKAAVYRAIYARRSHSSFVQRPVPELLLNRILDAAHHAPSLGLVPPWRFLVLPGEQLAAWHAERGGLGPDSVAADLKAPAPLSVLIATQGDPMAQACSWLAMQNLWLAARAEGLGVAWHAIVDPQALSEHLRLPEELKVQAWLSLGWPTHFTPEPRLEALDGRARVPLSQVRLPAFGGHDA